MEDTIDSCKRKRGGVICGSMEMKVSRIGQELSGKCVAVEQDELDFILWLHSRLNIIPQGILARIGIMIHLSQNNQNNLELELRVSTRKDL